MIHEGAELAAVTYLRGVRDPSAVEAAVARVEGAQVFDQGAWIDGLFAEFRATTLRQIGVGSLLVLLVLALRYRRPAPVLAAFLPSAATALLVLSLLALGHSPANLLHAVSLLLVMGMGVDYGVFIVESEDDPARLGRTLVSLGLCAATTVFVFGALALSAHPALRAIGVTTALGVASSWLLAPLAWVVLMPAPASR